MKTKIAIGAIVILALAVLAAISLTPTVPSTDEVRPAIEEHLKSMPKVPGVAHASEASEIRIYNIAPAGDGSFFASVDLIWEQRSTGESYKINFEKQGNEWVVISAEVGLAD